METTSRFPRKWFPHGIVGAPPPGVPISLSSPVVTGLGEVGKTISASTGTWTNSPTSYAYQWYRAGVAISGQTGPTYNCVLADKNQTVSVTVTAANGAGNSLAVPNMAPGFGVYSSTVAVALPTLILADPVREINHAKQSPTGNLLAATRYNQFSAGIATEGVSHLNTEIITINPSTGAVASIVPPISTLNNSNPVWDPAGAFVLYSSSNTTSGKNGCRKYTFPSLGLTIGVGVGGIPVGSVAASDTQFYAPSDLNVSDFDLNASGDLVMSGYSTGNSALYIWDGTVRTQLTTPTIVKAGNPEGDFDPSFKPGSTASSGTVACVRAVMPDPTGNNSVNNIAVITYGAGFANTGETVIAPIGSPSAFWGVPRWSSDGLKIIAALLDPLNPEICGLYVMNPDGSSKTLISLQAEQLYNTPSFPPGGGSSQLAPILYSTQFFPVVQALPSISGTVQVGQVLTASGGSGTYQWYREGAAIGGATASTYTPVAADQGMIIQVLSTSPFPPGYPVFSAETIPVLGTTVFYVSSSVGLDSNAGTLAAPWKTLAKVNAYSSSPGFSAGTSVLFKRGDTWRTDGCATSSGAQLSPSSSGTAGVPIVFDAYGTGANPVIDGSFDLSTTGAWQASGTTNVWQSVHTFNGLGNPGNGLPNNRADDPGNLIWGISAVGSPNVPSALVNAHYGVMTGGGTGGVWWSSGQAGLTSTGQWNFNTSTNKVQVYCVGNPATNLPGVNGDLRSAIDACNIYFNAQSNITFQNITLNYCGASPIDTGGAGGTCNNITIRDMVIQWFGGGNISGASTADSRYGDGWDIEGGCSGMLMERIWFHQGYDTGPGPQCGGPHQDNITIRNCVFTYCGAFYSSFFLGGTPTCSGLYIYNNTIYLTQGAWCNSPTQRPNGAENVFALFPGCVTASVVQTNMAVNNNIFAGVGGVGTGGGGVPGFGIIGTAWNVGGGVNASNPFTSSGAWLNYNCWPVNINGNGPQQIALSSGNFPMANWVKGTNIGGAGTFSPALEVNGIFSQDPQFTSQAAYNFLPGYVSPCRNAGANLYNAAGTVPPGAPPGLVWDFFHNPRPASGAFVMGAFEYSSGASISYGINLNVAISVGDIPLVDQ